MTSQSLPVEDTELVENHMDFIPLIIGIFQIVFGLAFFSGSIFVIARWRHRLRNWTKTSGTVVDVQISQGMYQPHATTRNTLFRPKVRFQRADGTVVEHEPLTSNNWSNYAVGEQIPVYYDPQHPEKVMFGPNATQRMMSIVFAFVGGGFVLFGIFFTFLAVTFNF